MPLISSASSDKQESSSNSMSASSVSSVFGPVPNNSPTLFEIPSSMLVTPGGGRGTQGGNNAMGNGAAGPEMVKAEQEELAGGASASSSRGENGGGRPQTAPSSERITVSEITSRLSKVAPSTPKAVASRPKDVATRAEAVAQVLQAFRLAVPAQTKDPLRNAIAAARKLGVIRGDANGNIRPNAPVTSRELTIMVQRAAALAKRKAAK
jgi:hypothetical protein